MKKALLLGWGMSVGLWLMGQGHEARLAAIDVLHYDFQIAVSDTSDKIFGLASVELKLLQTADKVRLDLVAVGADGKGMQVKSVQIPGHNGLLAFRQAGDTLEITLPSGAVVGAAETFEIRYEGIPADGLIISQNERDGRSFFGDNWPNRAHYWLPTVDHPSDKASVDFTIVAPAHYEIVANGKLVDQRVAPNGTQTSHWHNGELLPTKVMVFGAADFALQTVGEVNGIPVSTWVFEKDEEAGFKDYAQGKDILRWFIDQVGPYPWDKLANVQSRTRYGGMENASCIFYADNSVTGTGSCEALMAHEIAHQWFGNSASEANWYHIWLSEGFATYFTHLYFERKYGEDAFRKRLEADRSEILGWAGTKKLCVVDPRIKDLNQLLSINSYQKGGWVLHMLRQQIGDELFFKGLREYYARYKFGNALSEDLQKVLEEVSGQDLKPFFQQWLYRPGYPDLDVVWSWKKKTKEISFVVTQKQEGEPFDFKLDIAALADLQVSTIGTMDIHSKVTKGKFPLSFMPEVIRLDPEVKLLFKGKAREK